MVARVHRSCLIMEVEWITVDWQHFSFGLMMNKWFDVITSDAPMPVAVRNIAIEPLFGRYRYEIVISAQYISKCYSMDEWQHWTDHYFGAVRVLGWMLNGGACVCRRIQTWTLYVHEVFPFDAPFGCVCVAVASVWIRLFKVASKRTRKGCRHWFLCVV